MKKYPRPSSLMVLGAFSLAVLSHNAALANTFAQRGDIINLPDALKNRLVKLAERPATYEPMRAFAEAESPSQLFEYYLLDSHGFQPNVFTTVIPDINSGVIPTAANAANRGQRTLGSVRVALEPKPGLPTNPNDPGAFIDIWTDISGLFVINNESGWYEGWMIHDLRVPAVAQPRPDGRGAQFGAITLDDAKVLASMGNGHNLPGRMFTVDGLDVQFPAATDDFPEVQTNVVPIQLSMGAYNCLQQADCHSYWEFNEYTNWVHPQYELPFTGGVPGTFAAGRQYDLQSLVPGDGPAGRPDNDKRVYGDNPNNPRDPDRLQTTSLDDLDLPQPPDEEHAETRLRFIPSGLANEILLDVYVRLASFEPDVTNFNKRLFHAYAAEVARIDENEDGVVQVEEADEENESDGLPNERLYIPATQFNRFAVTREINDGLLAPRFAPSQRAWVLTGSLVEVSPSVDASVPTDADLR
ncbi:MAG: hypothetical protein ACREYF_07540 [Gammaproteobacteria bacterium]